MKCETDAGEYSSSDTFIWSSSDTSVVKTVGSGNSCTVTSVAAGKSGTATVTCKVNGKVTLTCNGSLFQTVTVEVTSTDSDYQSYVSWRKGIEAKLWTTGNVAGLTDLEKISMPELI